MEDDVLRTAELSDDGLYRYSLTRVWGRPRDMLTFVMLNPSTADHQKDDPTIRRCMGFARSWGFGAITVVNLYALRATRPVHLWEAADPVGPRNDEAIRQAAREASRSVHDYVIAAWGANAKPDRVDHVRRIVEMRTQTRALGLTQNGSPRHPLYVKGDTQPIVMWQ